MKKENLQFKVSAFYKIGFIVMFFLNFPLKNLAQTVVTVSGGASITCPATPTAIWSTPPTGVTFSNWSRGHGVTCASSSTGLSGSGFNTLDAAASYAAGKYYSVTLTADATHTFTLSSVVWNTSVSSGGANFTVKYSNNGGVVTDFGISAQTSTTSNTFTDTVNVTAGTSLVLYLIPSGTGSGTTTVRWLNGSSITVSAASTGVSPTFDVFPNMTKTYGDAGFSMTASSNSSGAISYSSSNTSVATIDSISGAVTIKGAGSSTISVNQAASLGFDEGSASAILTVNKANGVTIMANDVSKTYGTVLNNGLSSGFSASGFQYADNLGTGATVNLSYGVGALATDTATLNNVSPAVYSDSVVPSGLVAGIGATYNPINYNAPVYVEGAITVSKANQSITFNSLSDKNSGDVPFALGGSASSGLAVSYATSNPGVVTVNGGTATITGAGLAIITASQLGDLNFYAANEVSQIQNVSSLLSKWTFENVSTTNSGNSPVTSTGSNTADQGLQTTGTEFSAFHTSALTGWSNLTGDGSAKSLTSSNWGVGDYYQFKVNTSNFHDITVAFDQTGSNTGPSTFKIQYSTDGVSFYDFGNSYAISNDNWNSTTYRPLSNRAFHLGAVTELSNKPSVYFRVVNMNLNAISGTFGTSGTNRIDNFTVTGTACENSPATISAHASTSFCEGGSVTLTANEGSSYLWSTGAVTQSITISTPGNYSVQVTNANGCIATSTITPVTIIPNSTHVTTVSACDSYFWNGTTYTESGIYTGFTSNCVTEKLDLTIIKPEIISQPKNTALCSVTGSNVGILVISNIPNATYSWQYREVTTTLPNPEWITISGGNAGGVYFDYDTAALKITKSVILPKKGTQYRALITGECGTLTSDIAQLTLLSTAKAGTITASATSVCTGNSISFVLNNYAGTSVQWQSASNLGKLATDTSPAIPADWADISGALGSNFTTDILTISSNKYYRAVVTNSCTNTTAVTATKTISVNPLSVSGTVTGGGAVCLESPTKNTLRVSGYTGIIQWEYSVDDGNTWEKVPAGSSVAPFAGVAFTTISSGKSASYSVYGFAQNTRFRVSVTSGRCDAVTSNEVQYTITEAQATSILADNGTVCYKTATNLTLADGYVGSIRWKKSSNYGTMGLSATWTNVSGSTPIASTGAITATTWFKAVLTVGGTCIDETTPIAISVFGKPLAKSITSSTPSGTALLPICNTVAKELNVKTGYLADRIQWEKAVVPLLSTAVPIASDYALIEGATDSSISIIDGVGGKNYYRAKFMIADCATTAVYSTPFVVYYKECGSAGAKLVTGNKTLFDVFAYRNLFADHFTLRLTAENEEKVNLEIYDMLGRLVEKKGVKPDGIFEFQMGENYASGIYNIKVSQGREQKMIRVIKQ